ncbi:MAG: hypothetical protein IKU01_01650 [Bacteroidales bacterium]|nr:hypothetical protein [Bacteroidales bacterium]
MINKERAFFGFPEDFHNKFLIYPPLIKDIIGNIEYPQYHQLLTLSQEDIEDELAQDKEKDYGDLPTPFEFLLANSYHDKEFERIARNAFYFFIHQEVTFIYEQKKILIGDLEEELARVKDLSELIFLEEEEFFEFQNNIRESIGEKAIEPPDPNEHPKIKRMKALARYRDRIKAKSGKGLNLETLISSICCMGIGITPLNIGEMTYVAANTLVMRYQEKEKYEIDIRSIQAGAEAKKIKPKYWIRNLDE